jgi:Flp pilus assembly protein TadD
MNQPLRTTSAVSLVILSSMIAGCAAPQARVGSATHFGGKADMNVGLATRAMAALNSNNVPMAIDLGERAVAQSPNDAGFRALLGNAYFAGGRFRSAEAAYRDSLTLVPEQPQVVLKLALVEIALGKNHDAVAVLNAARPLLDASDYGLALALAGRVPESIAILDAAARQKDADPVVRQNLALAHALAGEWVEARTIAAQDVPAAQLDARIQQWMQLAKPQHASDQVAALVGVKPAVVDAGQPAQLALNKGEMRMAQAAAPAAPVKAPATTVAAAPVPRQSAEATAPAKQALTQAAAPSAVPTPTLAVAPPPPSATSTLAAFAATAVSEAKAVLAAVMPHSAAPAPKLTKPRNVAQPGLRHGNSPAVVQLGAYQTPDRVLSAWNGASRKYAALKAYSPMSARFASPKGTFYRLSVRGFSSVGEANALCSSLKSKGGSCFVRNVAGDTPVQYASR